MSVAARPASAAFAPARPARAASLPALAVISIHLLVFGSLFTGLPGPTALGELRGEGTVPGVIALLAAAGLSGAVLDVRSLRSALIFAPFVLCILLSYAVNADAIANAHFLGREGGEKFVTSLLVVVFYVLAFFAAASLAQVYGARAMLLCGANAALWCGYLMIAEMAVEIVSWFVPPLRETWRVVRGAWVEPGSSQPMFRLVGFAPEPSLASIAAMGLLGLLAAEAAIRGGSRAWPRRRARAVGVLFVLLFILELTLANARTFMIGLCGVAVALALANRHVRRVPPSIRAAVIVLAPLAVQVALIWTVIQADPSTRTISNVTRSVGMIAASQLWAQHPLLGLGLGQYGFHFRGVVPSWGLVSFEISRYFEEDQYKLIAGLPPTFSMFTRIGAELGALGLAAWLLAPFAAIRGLLLRPPGALAVVIVCALAAQIWVGLSFDSYRNFYYWFWLAIAGAWARQ